MPLTFKSIRGDSLYYDVDRLLDELTPKQVQEAYTVARAAFRKRVRRIEKEGFESPMVDKFKSTYKSYSDIAKSPSTRGVTKTAARLLVSLMYDIERPTASVSGVREIRESTIATLKDRGFTRINEENIDEFGRFMEYARQTGLALIYDSNRIAKSIQTHINRKGHGDEAEWYDLFVDRLGQSEAAVERRKAAYNAAHRIKSTNLRNIVRQVQDEKRKQKLERKRKKRK